MAGRAPTKTAAVAPLGHVGGQATLWEHVPPKEIQTACKGRKLLRNIHTFSRPSAKRQIPAVIAMANRARALAGGPAKVLGCEEKTADLFGTRNSSSPGSPAVHNSKEAAVDSTSSGKKGEASESLRPTRPPPKKSPRQQRNFPRLIGLKGGTTSLQRVEETVSTGTGTDESEGSASTSSLSSSYHMPTEGTSRSTAQGASGQVGYVSCCPVCGVYMEIQVIDPHLDTCLLQFD